MANLVNVWKIIPINELSKIRKDDALELALEHGRVFVGWGAIGNIVSKRIDDTDEMEIALKRAYPDSNNVNNGIRALMNFAYVVAPGDLVVIAGNTKSSLCMIDGEYEYEDSVHYGMPAGYDHQRRINVISRDAREVERFENICSGFDGSQYVTVRKSRHPIDPSIVRRVTE